MVSIRFVLRIYKYKSFSLKPENKNNKKCKTNNHIFTKKTQVRFNSNVLAFEVKRTYVFGSLIFSIKNKE